MTKTDKAHAAGRIRIRVLDENTPDERWHIEDADLDHWQKPLLIMSRAEVEFILETFARWLEA